MKFPSLDALEDHNKTNHLGQIWHASSTTWLDCMISLVIFHDAQNSPSFKSCLLSLPGTHNWKLVGRNNGLADSSTEVKVLQTWKGKRPVINPILHKFFLWLASERIRELHKFFRGSAD